MLYLEKKNYTKADRAMLVDSSKKKLITGPCLKT